MDGRNGSDFDTFEKSDAAKREEEVLAFWKEHRIFEKSLEKPAPKGDFVFYEGPPTANGRPGVHHLESRSFKDAIPRYRTMRGYRVPRRAGWDTHGLPVELEVEKQLGFTGKKDIEAYGIAEFNKKCRASVMSYVDEWGKFTERIGYWVDQGKAYFTFDAPFMESVWNIVKKVDGDGRLYKDYKILPWCARCGTALSSHELAQGYAEVKDLSLTVKFRLIDEPNTSILAWTTTPWTLPGNIALAVGNDITYVRYAKTGENGKPEKVIVAKERAHVLGEGWTREEEFPGSALVGKKYRPLFPYAEALAPESEKPKFDKAFQVHAADFVTTEDGTGIVHTAVMYGADDFALGTEVGLPKVHLVAPDGTFIPGTGFLEGRFVKDDAVAVDILKHLQEQGSFFSKENYTHTYPFCWRCKTPLIYYARDSWYIRMQDLRETLVAENNQVNWEPGHIKDGRMGEWLRNVKDWAISRERYWGTPLPVWQSEDGSERIVVGSIDELKGRTKRNGNTFLVMRHGEAEHNIKNIVCSDVTAAYGLTETGRQQVKESAAGLKGRDITTIYASPFARARETAELVAAELGLSTEAIRIDPRIGEFNFGDLEGTSFDGFLAYRDAHMRAYADPVPNGDSYFSAKNRFAEFAYDVDARHSGENILVVSHGVALESFEVLTRGAAQAKAQELMRGVRPAFGKVVEFPFTPLPHNDAYELDLHRPYIDDVVLVGDSGNELRRVREVMDVWFDSGAMPFAQDHYPFENKAWVEGKGYPADFISEAIDQTRGWFYTLMAVGVLTGRGAPYRNVICLGHLLDEKGQKMSKSKGNVINPWEAMAKWGADTLRFWMYYVNQPGDSKNFDEKTVKEAARALSWLENSAKFHALFAASAPGAEAADAGNVADEPQVIDRWMEARLDVAVRTVTAALDAYRPYEATRELAALFEDLSQWYVRRVRDRARDGDAAALRTLHATLHASARMLAPLAPFLAEVLFRDLRTGGDPESVHLADWPEPKSVSGSVLDSLKSLVGMSGTTGAAAISADDQKLLDDMARLRTLASEALMLRQKANLKVRQPLAALSIPGSLLPELQALLADELNVKEVRTGAPELSLDTELTPDLVREGDVREFLRAVNDARKAAGFEPKDQVRITVAPEAESTLVNVTLPGVAGIDFAAADGALYAAELSTGKVAFSLSRTDHAVADAHAA